MNKELYAQYQILRQQVGVLERCANHILRIIIKQVLTEAHAKGYDGATGDPSRFDVGSYECENEDNPLGECLLNSHQVCVFCEEPEIRK